MSSTRLNEESIYLCKIKYMHSMILLTTVTTPSEEKKASFYLEPVSSIHLINKSFFLFIYLSFQSI